MKLSSLRLSPTWRRIKGVARLAASAALLIGLLPAQPKASRLAGRVGAEGGIPNGVYVLWTREVAFSTPEASRSGAVHPNSFGDFEITGLPDGIYTLCAKVSGHDLLDPCLWNEPLRIEIRQGETVDRTGLNLAMRRGTRLRLQFDDPDRLLHSPTENPSGQAGIQAGLWLERGRYVPMEKTKVLHGKQIFEAVVPPDSFIRAHIQVHGASVEQVLTGQSEDNVGYPMNPAGFGVRSAQAGIKIVRFRVHQ